MEIRVQYYESEGNRNPEKSGACPEWREVAFKDIYTLLDKSDPATKLAFMELVKTILRAEVRGRETAGYYDDSVYDKNGLIWYTRQFQFLAKPTKNNGHGKQEQAHD